MSIISIPTSFKGVAIPGAVVGPLASLFGLGGKMDVLQYPRDLGSSSKPHAVQFHVNVPTTSRYVDNYNYSTTQTNSPKPLIDLGSMFGSLNKVQTDNNIQLSPNTKRLAASISLYMPNTVNTTQAMSYQEDNLGNYLLPKYGELAAGFMNSTKDKTPGVNSFLNVFTSNKEVLDAIRPLVEKAIPIDIALKGQGFAVNPQVQLIFKGISLRTFTMEFLFSPYNQQEAQNVKKIIQAFKFHSAPEVGGAATDTGRFFVVPSTFDIDFLFNGSQNKNIHKISECVLESVVVDYAPNSWATFPDGTPVQTRMSLQFRELDIMDKDKVLKGY